VMGNRFRGGIALGAMPFLHKYLGNPVLSFLGRLFFPIRCGDFHCGLRAFNRDRILSLGLMTTGMEFASEMIVCAALARYKITEVPTTLKKDGRSHPPHLRTWRDGWRHLRFLLLYCPRWLFVYPGVAFITFGFGLTGLLFAGPFHLTDAIEIDIHSFVIGSTSLIIGIQCVTFGIIARRYGVVSGLLPPIARLKTVLDNLTLEKMLILAGLGLSLGIVGVLYALKIWASTGFGPLNYPIVLRVLILSMALITISVQFGFAAFFLG